VENQVSLLKSIAMDEIDALAAHLVEISDDIHAHPEIRFKEHYSSRRLADALEAGGFAVERGTAGMDTAFRGQVSLGRKSPTIAFLGEYDALAEVGHACGHNIIGTAALGAGLALARVFKAEEAVKAGLQGRILVLGTPGEEAGGGKVVMVENGVFRDVEAAMIVHPGSLTRVHSESIASYKVTIRFRGKPAHSASSPHEGINALDGLLMTFNAINALRQHITPDARIHGIITKGGFANNIVPELAEAQMCIRAADKKYHHELIEKVKNCARGAELQTGAKVEFELFGRTYDPMKSNSILEDVYRKNLGVLGLSEDTATKRGSGSTDMANVSQVVPSIHPSIAIGPKEMIGHTPEMCAASKSSEGHKGLLNAAKCMAMTALDLLSDPELLEKARAEFRA